MNLERENSPLFKNSLDLLVTAKKVFMLQIVGTIIIILGVLFFIFFQKGIIKKLEKRLEKRDVIILTNSGVLTTKTITNESTIVKQFGEMAFLMTLNYDNKSPLPQLDFMRVYASHVIYKEYLNMITNDAKLEHKLYTTYIDTTKPIIVQRLNNPNLYKIVIQGIQYIYSSLNKTAQHVKLTLIISKNLNSMPGNFYNLTIISYNLTKSQ